LYQYPNKMKNKLTKLTAFSLLLATAIFHKATAQTDPHFTQNYTYPMYLNPALTGGSDGDYRIAAIYRSQWGSVGNPYRTTGVSVDTRTDKNISLGLNLMNQTSGDGGFNYLNTYASIAYTGVKFGKQNEHRLVFAMQAGLINRHFDQSKFKWGEQWNPITGYNASNPLPLLLPPRLIWAPGPCTTMPRRTKKLMYSEEYHSFI
jgi:type IX secretion system PorP/SprF family membrane protein